MREYDEEPWDEIDSHEDKELNHLIDELLNEARPDRYFTRDRSWMDDIVQVVADELERRPNEAGEAARRLVHQREGQATKSANRALRRIAQEGTLPIGWGTEQMRADLLSPPLSINGERVRLGAASPSDLRLWRQVREREAEKRLGAEAETWKGAELLEVWSQEQGVQRVEDLRDFLRNQAA
jgi:hypothetical protein